MNLLLPSLTPPSVALTRMRRAVTTTLARLALLIDSPTHAAATAYFIDQQKEAYEALRVFLPPPPSSPRADYRVCSFGGVDDLDMVGASVGLWGVSHLSQLRYTPERLAAVGIVVPAVANTAACYAAARPVLTSAWAFGVTECMERLNEMILLGLAIPLK